MDKTSRLILIILSILAITSSLAAARFILVNRSIYQRLLETEDLLSQETENKESLSKQLQVAEQEMRKALEKQEAAELDLRRYLEDYKALKVKYELAIREKEDLTSQAQNLTQEKLALEDKVSGFEKDTFLAKLLQDKAEAELLIGKVSDELLVEKRKSDSVSKELNNLKSEKESLQDELQRLTDSKRSLEAESSDLNEKLETMARDREALKRQVRDLERKVQSGSDELGRLKAALEETRSRPGTTAAFGTGAVELPPIIVKGGAQAPVKTSQEARQPKPSILAPTPEIRLPLLPKPSIEGEIISVNEENNFVIVNLGEEDGMKLGMSFDVYQGDERIGEIEVIELRSRIAACDIKDIREGEEIKAGDVVR